MDLYVQHGGGDDIDATAEALPARFVVGLEQYVAGGGRYLGLCMGAYLAGPVAFGLVETDLDGEVGRPCFAVTDSSSTVMDGSFFTTHAAERRWIDAGQPGTVVSIVITWVWTGSAYVVPSAMAKFAVDAMTKSLDLVLLLVSDAADYVAG